MASRPLSRLVFGRVMHRRYTPVSNHFNYPVFFLLLNLAELERLDSWLFGINRHRLFSLHFKDYSEGEDPRIWVRQALWKQGVLDCDGDIWLQTFPRLFGYLFNPVSFWYCTRRDGSVGAIIAEVNNTFGDKQLYLLTPNEKNGEFKQIEVKKTMYVSPFYPVAGDYRFFFNTDFAKPRVNIDYYLDDTLQLNTAIWGKAVPLSTSQLLLALFKQPLMSFGVIVKIHWQALRLWLKRIPLFKRPTSSPEEV